MRTPCARRDLALSLRSARTDSYPDRGIRYPVLGIQLDSPGIGIYRRHMIKIVALSLLVTLGLGASHQARPPAGVGRQVYIEPMGQDHEAVRFRKLMTDHLVRSGFSIASDAAGAELILSTTLSTPVVSGETRAYASAEVRTRDGNVSWTGDFPAREGWVQTKAREAVAKLAEEIARAVSERSS
jgi:hypothetical protein